MKQKKTKNTGIRRYCSLFLAVCVLDILIIFNTYRFSAHQVLYSAHQYYVTFTLPVIPVHSPTNALFINLVKSFKFILKYTIISLLHVSFFNDHHQGALSAPN